MFKTVALDSVANRYVDKNVGTSTPGTRLEQTDRNIEMDELVASVESSGQTLDATGVKRSQVARAMFLNGVGAQSMVDTGAANAKVLTPISGASGYVFGESYAQLTGAAFMFKNLVINTGATTVNVGQTAGTLLGVKSLTQAGGVAFVGGELIAGSYYLILYDLSNDRFELVTIESFTAPRGHIDGLIMSNGTDTEHDIDISVGEATDSTGAYLMKLTAAMTKQIDVAWAVGDNAGGMFTGSVAVDTWYSVFEIRKDSDGSIDFGFDTSIVASNKPAGYSNYRYIGSVLTDGSSNILGFSQLGDEFLLDDPPLDINLANTQGVAAALLTLSTPLGYKTHALLNISMLDAIDQAVLYLSSPDIDDEAASISAAPLGTVVTPFAGHYNMQGGFKIRTNTASQIRARASLDLLDNVYITTLGWVDPRGKDV